MSTRLGHKVSRYLGKSYSECFCEGVLDKINVEISEFWEKQTAFLNVGGPHLISSKSE